MDYDYDAVNEAGEARRDRVLDMAEHYASYDYGTYQLAEMLNKEADAERAEAIATALVGRGCSVVGNAGPGSWTVRFGGW